MEDFITTIIIRHKRENKNKCSLKGLETRSDLLFLNYPREEYPDLSGRILLTLDAPILSKEDKTYGLILLDGTWKLADKMYRQLPQKDRLIMRSLPKELITAYPRKQTDCIDPTRGLASIEALYAAYHLLGYSTDNLLTNYYWKEAFLEKNRTILG